MKPAPFEYYAPTTIANALQVLRDVESARPLAGGQSLVPMMAVRLARPAALVDLNTISELTGISEEDGSLVIRSMTRQAMVLHSDVVGRRVPLLIEALANVGHPATRARGTIGGSVANADPASELPVAMVALDARFVIAGQQGHRTVAAQEFFTGMFETALGTDELLIEIRIPFQRGVSSFLEISRRKGDFAIVSVAVKLSVDAEKRCAGVAVVFGGIGPTPTRCSAAERELLGRALDDSAIAASVSATPLELVELDSHGASRSYRHRLARVLLGRALKVASSRGEVR